MLQRNTTQAQGDNRPPSSGPNGQEATGPAQLPARPPFTRVDSRSSITPSSPRPGVQYQQRPQFQPGGPVTTSPTLAPRSGTPITRASIPSVAAGSPQIRGQAPPTRPVEPQLLQQGPRPQQSPTTGQILQRAPVPNNLQFGPRQPPQFGGATTPESSKAQLPSQLNGTSKNGAPFTGQIAKQTSQGSLKGLEISATHLTKTANLEPQNTNNDNQNANKPEAIVETPGLAKGRSYSIAAAPGTPSPLKVDEDRRKSISTLGGKVEEFTIRSPGLGLIQESKDNIRGSKDSIKSEASNDGNKDNIDRPESRLSGSRMAESIMGSLTNLTQKKKVDDDDDVVLQNNVQTLKNDLAPNQKNNDLSDRSPSLTRSDDSPEPKNVSQSSVIANKSQRATPEPQRPKTPKELKPEITVDVPSDEKKSIVKTKKSPDEETKSMTMNKKPTELYTSVTPTDSKKSTPRKVVSAPKSRSKDGDNDSGVDESTQGNDLNGSPSSPNKKILSKLPNKEKSSNSLKTSLSRSSSKSATAKTPENPPPSEKKKVPMNKVQVGNAPSPNIKAVKSKIGSLDNTTYKPGGGKIKIENRKLEFNATPKIAAKNEAYTPSGGTKKIITTKLEWNAKSKVGSLQNTAYKPGGGDKKIETVKLDFKDKAKPKVGSTANITHKPGGGTVKIENQKLDFKAQSKIGSLDNVKHKPGGGDIKIFDDKDYIKQVGGQSPLPSSHNQSRQESPVPPSAPPKSDENLNQAPS
ncbi:microtubule-associated protein 4 isoform X2 [Battus philenor]|uniref:microtubule-associated protein 4 isoform X2 n=1 Tax=Battus philenor TaxID=42288 RepID=UPI0035D0F968